MQGLVGLIRLWFGLSAPVSRRAYALSGFGLMAFKYAVEAAVVGAVVGRTLTPLDYLNPLLGARRPALGEYDWLVVAIAVWTLPFLWIGASMTLRRAEDAGRSPLLVLLYFVPILNYVVMLTLCLLPSAARTDAGKPATPPPVGHGGMRSALLGMAWGALLALSMVIVSVRVFGSYGTILFVATPFVMGAASAYVFNRPVRRDLGSTLLVALCSVGLAGAALLLFALEGVLCLAMAAPIAIALALMGAVLGRVAAGPVRPPAVAALVLPLPLLAWAEGAQPAPEVREVLSVVEVRAPPDLVWPHVVAVSPLREPPAWFFRLGIAYPLGATIDGRGTGAVRRCEFSTGPFVEPITTWDEPRRLAFDVAAQPAAMREWSPYRDVTAPHLDGYLRVQRGEFRLIPLAGGGTRLEGRTWYEMRVFPAAYWSLWSDAVIHRIHDRVLRQIQADAAEALARGRQGEVGP
jgi:uncharacterized membrane protein YhaH (DUF805 family)